MLSASTHPALPKDTGYSRTTRHTGRRCLQNWCSNYLISERSYPLSISKIFELAGYEADDIIGTIARDAAAKGADVFIVTADKDMLQLVDEQIKIYDPMKDRVLDVAYVRDKFGVGPERVTEFMALTGDASDNIPGIKGVGEKTAKELLSSFDSIEDLLEHPEKIKRERLRKMVSDNKDIVLLSQKLATIDISVPVEIDSERFRAENT